MTKPFVGSGPASQRLPYTPPTRALRAMESAVLRARETQALPESHGVRERKRPADDQVGHADDQVGRDNEEDEPDSSDPAEPTDAGPVTPPTIGDDPAERPHDRPAPRLFTSLGALALVLAVGVTVLFLALAGGPTSKPASAGSSTATHQVSPRTTGGATSLTNGSTLPALSVVTPSSVPPPPPAAPAATTTPSSVFDLANGEPLITSLDPSIAAAGQRIVVVGANFLSSSGVIFAAFGGQTTGTSCPTQSSCTVTVPPQTGGAVTPVTITTSTGTSNGVNFTYSGALPPAAAPALAPG